MNKDHVMVWVLEYLVGIALIVAVLPYIVHPQPGWSTAHGWAYLLFIACAGICLISSASGTRQRIELSKRVNELEKRLAAAGGQTQNTTGSPFISKEHLVGSVN